VKARERAIYIYIYNKFDIHWNAVPKISRIHDSSTFLAEV